MNVTTDVSFFLIINNIEILSYKKISLFLRGITAFFNLLNWCFLMSRRPRNAEFDGFSRRKFFIDADLFFHKTKFFLCLEFLP